MREKWVIRQEPSKPGQFHVALFDADTDKPALCPCCGKHVKGTFTELEPMLEYIDATEEAAQFVRDNLDDPVLVLEEVSYQ